jgi:hypothetical protein
MTDSEFRAKWDAWVKAPPTANMPSWPDIQRRVSDLILKMSQERYEFIDFVVEGLVLGAGVSIESIKVGYDGLGRTVISAFGETVAALDQRLTLTDECPSDWAGRISWQARQQRDPWRQ